MNNSKYCLTKKINIKINDEKELQVNLDDFYPINIPICDSVELPGKQVKETQINDLRNVLVELFTNYYHISDSYIKLSNKIDESDLETILKVKYITMPENDECIFEFENNCKAEILHKYRNICDNKYLDNILTLIQNFLVNYLFIKEFDLLTINQPINFETNLTLFYNYIIYSLYYHAIEIDDVNNYIFFKKEKLLIYYTLSKYHDLIFDNRFDKNLSMDKPIDQLLKLLFLTLSKINLLNHLNILIIIYIL